MRCRSVWSCAVCICSCLACSPLVSVKGPELTVGGFPKIAGKYMVGSSTCPFLAPGVDFEIAQSEQSLTVSTGSVDVGIGGVEVAGPGVTTMQAKGGMTTSAPPPLPVGDPSVIPSENALKVLAATITKAGEVTATIVSEGTPMACDGTADAQLLDMACAAADCAFQAEKQ